MSWQELRPGMKFRSADQEEWNGIMTRCIARAERFMTSEPVKPIDLLITTMIIQVICQNAADAGIKTDEASMMAEQVSESIGQEPIRQTIMDAANRILAVQKSFEVKQ